MIRIGHQKKPNLTASQNNPNNNHDSAQKLKHHINELRNRLFGIVLSLLVASSLGLYLKDLLVSVVTEPLRGEKLMYLTPGGGFSFIFSLCLYFGVTLTIPVIIYNLYRFVEPIVGRAKRRLVTGVVVASIVLAGSGATFGYFVTIPAALNFLSTFAGDAVIPNLTADAYLSFVASYVVGLALLFQLPLILMIIDHFRPIKPGTLSNNQDKAIIGATVLGALITPTPDAVNMAIVAVPIIAIYELGVVAVMVRRHARKRSQQRTALVNQVLPLANDEGFLNEMIQDLVSQPVLQVSPESLSPLPAPAVDQVFEADQYTPDTEAQSHIQTVIQNTPHTVVAKKARRLDGFISTSVHPGTQEVISRRIALARQQSLESIARRVNSANQVRSIDGFSIVKG